jgi:hypothetical protein
MYYKKLFDDIPSDQRPEFKIEQTTVLNLLMVAHYLEL